MTVADDIRSPMPRRNGTAGSDRAPLIRLRGITYTYDGGRSILDRLDFDLFSGDRIGLVAPNGSGKTTLFHVIMGLLKPQKGSIEIFGEIVRQEKEFRTVRQRVGLLFQDSDDQLFSPTVLEDVAFGPLNQGKNREEAIAISKRTLSFLGLDGFEDRMTFKLSGGEKRLVSLATILAMEPDVLLLDEPSTGLDKLTRERLAGVLNRLEKSYVLISHNSSFLLETTDRILTMEKGRIHLDEEVHIHEHLHAHKLGRVPHQHD